MELGAVRLSGAHRPPSPPRILPLPDCHIAQAALPDFILSPFPLLSSRDLLAPAPPAQPLADELILSLYMTWIRYIMEGIRNDEVVGC